MLTNTIVALNAAADSADLAGTWTGTNNIVGADPGFAAAPIFQDGVLVNGDSLDLSLAEGSAAIDAGLNSAVTVETDIAGNPRVINGIVDIGAYEYGAAPVPVILDAPEISTGSRGVYPSCGANRHRIAWDAVENASGYELQYSADGARWTAVSAAETAVVVTGLTYGQDVQYRVRALGTGSYTDSDWSEVKTFNVCPMDVNGDGDIGGLDRNILAVSWGAEEGDGEYQFCADINADGDVGGLDRNFLGSNWGAEAGDGDLTYPKPLAVTDIAFAAYGSGELEADPDMF